jgi:hypothetical protein
MVVALDTSQVDMSPLKASALEFRMLLNKSLKSAIIETSHEPIGQPHLSATDELSFKGSARYSSTAVKRPCRSSKHKRAEGEAAPKTGDSWGYTGVLACALLAFHHLHLYIPFCHSCAHHHLYIFLPSQPVGAEGRYGKQQTSSLSSSTLTLTEVYKLFLFGKACNNSEMRGLRCPVMTMMEPS